MALVPLKKVVRFGAGATTVTLKLAMAEQPVKKMHRFKWVQIVIGWMLA